MSLIPIRLEGGESRLPREVELLIREAEERADAFLEAMRPHRPTRFLPSDPAEVYAALEELKTRRLLTGTAFCEWGSGMGALTCMASMMGFEACGIEQEPLLVAASEQLAAMFDCPVRFHEGDFTPPGFDRYRDVIGDTVQLIRAPVANPLYERLGMHVSDFDVVCVYPWPEEAEWVCDLFEATAAEHAVLLLYEGPEDLSAFRLACGASL